MVKSNQDLEGYFIKLDRRYEVGEDGTFIVAVAADQPPVAVRLAEPVILLQVRIGAVPRGDAAGEAQLYRKLLELNTSDLVHAAYGLEGDEIVLTSALEAQSLDLNELEAALADLTMALTSHVPELRALAGEAEAKSQRAPVVSPAGRGGGGQGTA